MSDGLISAAAERVGGLTLKPNLIPAGLWMSPIRYGYSESDPRKRVLAFDIAPSSERRRRKKESVRIEVTTEDLLSATLQRFPSKNFRHIIFEKIGAVVAERGWGVR